MDKAEEGRIDFMCDADWRRRHPVLVALMDRTPERSDAQS